MFTYWCEDQFEFEYKKALRERGKTCSCCEGSGGIGSSVGGVTLRWKECSYCEGYGQVLCDKFSCGDVCVLLTGKYTGHQVKVVGYTPRLLGSDKNRLKVRITLEDKSKSLFVCEDNLQEAI